MFKIYLCTGKKTFFTSEFKENFTVVKFTLVTGKLMSNGSSLVKTIITNTIEHANLLYFKMSKMAASMCNIKLPLH